VSPAREHPAEQAFLSEAEAERIRIAGFDKTEATTFLATSDARQALANRKMFETSYMVRMSMGATLYRCMSWHAMRPALSPRWPSRSISPAC
jgi:hypothetical protein